MPESKSNESCCKPELILNFKKSKPSNPSIIVAFPGFGLIGLISTEFLIDHLGFEEVGKYWFEDLPATVAIHDSKMVSPVGIYYNTKYNVVLIHSISATHGLEWKAADVILEIAEKVKGKEIICLDGVGVAGDIDPTKISSKAFYFTTSDSAKKKLDAIKAEQLKEGILLGVGPALLIKSDIPVITLFAETNSNLPDSSAAAVLVDALDGYLGIDIDSKPLLEMAAKFQDKLRKIVSESKKIQDMHDSKQLSYMG